MTLLRIGIERGVDGPVILLAGVNLVNLRLWGTNLVTVCGFS